MLVSRFLNKQVAASESEVFRLKGSLDKLSVTLENQSATNTLVYKFQESDDGTNWTDKELPVSGGSTETQFAITSGNNHMVRIVSDKSRLRLLAYGDLMAGISISYNIQTPSDTTPVSIFPS